MKIKHSMTAFVLGLATVQTPWLLSGCSGPSTASATRGGRHILPILTTAVSVTRYRLSTTLSITGQQTLVRLEFATLGSVDGCVSTTQAARGCHLDSSPRRGGLIDRVGATCACLEGDAG